MKFKRITFSGFGAVRIKKVENIKNCKIPKFFKDPNED